jgi:hypothetical protein
MKDYCKDIGCVDLTQLEELLGMGFVSLQLRPGVKVVVLALSP